MMNGIPKIADLGIAKLMKTSGVLTKIGAQSYMAPEVLNGHLGAEADLWAVGVVLYTLMSGYLPF